MLLYLRVETGRVLIRKPAMHDYLSTVIFTVFQPPQRVSINFKQTNIFMPPTILQHHSNHSNHKPFAWPKFIGRDPEREILGEAFTLRFGSIYTPQRPSDAIGRCAEYPTIPLTLSFSNNNPLAPSHQNRRKLGDYPGILS
jgi:hypothetical protein